MILNSHADIHGHMTMYDLVRAKIDLKLQGEKTIYSSRTEYLISCASDKP